MAHRPALVLRPWLDNSLYDLLARDTVLHYDLRAHIDLIGGYWFSVEARAGGKALLARSLFRYDKSAGVLEAVSATPELQPAAWRLDNADMFARVHGALLDTRVMLRGFSRQTTHCHYVKALDCDPWPRGTLNTYSYGKGRPPGGAKVQRARKRPAGERVGVDIASARLPDIL